MDGKEIMFSDGVMCYNGEPFSGVYGIHCVANGKWYVGESKNVKRRVQCYIRIKKDGKQRLIFSALNKHGSCAFVCYVLERCPICELKAKEAFWGCKLTSVSPYGYNLKIGGTSNSVFSEETKQKMSISHTGLSNGPMSEDTKRLISEIKTGKKLGPQTDEHRQKAAESKRGKKRPPFTAEWLSNLSKARTGRKHTQETKDRIALSKIGKNRAPFSELWKSRISSSLKQLTINSL
jgi:group I intron endonuclease